VNDFINVPRGNDLFTVEGLRKFIGLEEGQWLKVAVKELVDNALDAAEGGSIQPAVRVNVEYLEDHILATVADNGPGIPPEVIRSIFDASTRTSSKVGFVAPSRGRQGNALPSILGIMGALWPPYEAPALEIRSRGVLHCVTALVDATGAAEIEFVSEPAETTGTTVKVTLPRRVEFEPPQEMVEAYTVFNPHLHLEVSGDVYPPTTDNFKKWQPGSSTPPHWYTEADFSKLVGYIRDRDHGTLLRDFVRQFKGLSSTKKAAAVCSVTHARTLEELAESGPDIEKVLRAMTAESKELRPSVLGKLGESHLATELEAYGLLSPVRYKRVTGTDQGLPWCLELAVARAEIPGLLVGVNYTPSIARDPFDGYKFRLELAGEELFGAGIRGLLQACHVDTFTDFVAICHLSHPAPRFTDSGKSRLDLSSSSLGLHEAVEATCRQFHTEGKRVAKGLPRKQRQAASKGPSLKDVVAHTLPQAIEDASGQGRFVFPIRNLFYSIRPLVQQYTADELRYEYFTKLVDEHENEHGEISGMFRDPRGHLVEPHGGEVVALGTREVDSYEMPPWLYARILFVEKEGLLPIFQAAKLAERFDMAIVGSKGFATRAARTLLQRADRQRVQIFCLHDSDPAGYEIYRTLCEATRAMPEHSIDVIDLGLRLEEALEMGLETETFIRKKKLSTGLRLTPMERQAFEGVKQGRKRWECRRVEINALAANPNRFLRFIEDKLKAHGCVEKLVPPVDVVASEGAAALAGALREWIREELERELGLSQVVEAIAEQLEPDVDLRSLPDILARWAPDLTPEHWRQRLSEEVCRHLSQAATNVREAVIGKIREGLPIK